MSAGTVSSAIVWQDVECGSYTADLPLWERLAEDCGGPLLELGCGCGRVALHLARLGHSVAGVDTDPELIRELARRASEAEVDLRAERADAAGFGLGESYRLIIAPMQLFQLLPGPAQRRDCLAAVAAHLEPGGTAAIAIVEGSAAGVPPTPPIPDVRELDGWVYSSLPLGVIEDGDALLVERLRQTVSPAGRLEEARDSVRLQVLSAARLEDEARDAGLRPAGRREIEATEMHAGSVVVLLEAGDR